MRKRNEDNCIAHSECLNLLFPAEKFSFLQLIVSFLEENPHFKQQRTNLRQVCYVRKHDENNHANLNEGAR